MGSSFVGVGVAEGFPRRDAVANAPLELGELREAALLTPAPDPLLPDVELEHAAVPRHERHLPDLLAEGGEQLLRRPGGAREEAAARAVADLDARPRAHRASRREAEEQIIQSIANPLL